MNILTLSLSNLRYKFLQSAFTILILALGIAVIITLLNVSTQLQQRFEKDLAGIDLVVGAKGSPLQLILSSVFHIDIPVGNIALSDVEKLRANPQIEEMIPLALGDNYQNFRIVGTTSSYAQHYQAQLAQGEYWTTNMQAVLGSEAARISALPLGARFAGSHGLSVGGEEHGEFPYTVVGILKPTGTVIDRLIFTDVSSVWYIHEHHHDETDHDGDDEVEHNAENHEITAMLLTYRSPAAAVSLPRLINKTPSLQAASPAFEMARLLKIIGVGSDAINMMGMMVIGLAGIGFFVTLYNAVQERTYDIALMRSLGATRTKIALFIMTEGLTLGIAGTLLGVILAHIAACLIQSEIAHTRHIVLDRVAFNPHEISIILAALLISVIASLIPAFLAYRMNITKHLAQGA